MRVLAVCLVFSLTVLLALPETSSAPACGCGKAKVGVGIRANTGVRVKWVTLGSLLARPNRNLGESEVNFYLRIFRLGRSRRTFYGQVFAPFRGESDLDYVSRINFIFTRVYPKMDCRCNRKYADYLYKYYTVLYARRSGESDEDWFSRVLTKTTENEDEYLVKVDLLKQYFADVDWSKVQIDAKSKTGFVLLSSSTRCTSSSARSLEESDNSDTLTEDEIKTYFAKLDGEDTNTYYSRVISRLTLRRRYLKNYTLALTTLRKYYPGLAIWYSPRYINLLKDYYGTLYARLSGETDDLYFQRIVTKENFETDEQCAQRIHIIQGLLPNLSLWGNAKYYGLVRNAYQLLYKKSSTEDDTTYFKRITARSVDESDSVYCERLALIKQTCADLPLWYSDQFLDLTRNFYISKYTKATSETDESLFKRIVTKETGETDEQCAQRVHLLHELFPSLDLWYNTKYASLTQTFYRTFYRKLETEDESSYYKRITTKFDGESNSVYINRLCILKRNFVHLPLWYSKQYVDVVKNYYITLYTKSSSETEESLFKRIVTKDDEETDEECVKRIDLVRNLFPRLSLWSDTKYYDMTKTYYQILYQKLTNEDETTYFKRIITKNAEETDTVYINRLACLKRTFGGLNLWYNKQYLDLTRSFYIARYAKASSETDESLFKRIVAKEFGETDNQWAHRVDIVHQFYPNLALWHDVKYYDFSKDLYQTIYKKTTSEDDITYFNRITTRTEQETDVVYLGRLNLIEKTYSSLSLWSSVDCLNILKPYYLLKYTKLSGESDEAYFTRLVARESCDISDDVYVRRLYLVQLLTTSSALWYDAKYYDKFTKTFYELYYRKLDSESCDGWLTRAITLLPGETDEYAIKRIALIRKSSGSCGCWTLDTLSKVQASKVFSAEYITKIRSSFFAISYKKTSSSSSSSTKSATAEASENSVEYSQGG